MSTQPENSNQSQRPFKIKALRLLGFLLFSSILLEFIVYFGSNIFLSDWAERKINQATQNIYQIDFDRLNISLFRRGVFLNGFTMNPVEGQKVSQEQALFTITLDHLALKNIWYNFADDVLYIGKIELDNPDAKLQLSETSKLNPANNSKTVSSQRTKPKSPVKQLEEEIQKSIKRLNLNAVYIKEMEINHADLFFYDFLSESSLKAENTRLHIKNIDWTTQKNWKTLFNASGYEFELENASFPLPDGVHSLRADRVFVNSTDQIIDLKFFQLLADKSKESMSYYDVQLRQLEISNIDLNKAFMTSQIEIGELILDEPIFNILRNNKNNKENIASGDLNELITGILKSVEIKELTIKKGVFSKNDFGDSLKNRIDFEGLDFKMNDFYLGEDVRKKENQFFYGQDASMEIQEARLFLADKIHVLTGQKILVSSFQNLIQIHDFSILPSEKAKLGTQSTSLIDLSLPKFELEGVDLKKLYNEGILEIEVMNLIAPQIEYTDLQSTGDQTEFYLVADLIKDWVEKIIIGRLDLQEGILQFKEKAGARSNDVEFEKFSLLIENIVIQPGKSIKTWKEFVIADEIVLSLDAYRLKLKDNLHEFIADKVLIDSKRSLVEITGFELRPEKPDQIQGILDSYEKSSIINLKVPNFKLEGIDLFAALESQELLIKQIVIQNPELSLTRYRKSKNSQTTDNQDQLESSQEFEDLLTSYFNIIQIDSLNFTDGKIGYFDFANKKEISFNEDKLSLNLKKFLVQKDQKNDRKTTFFSDEIFLNLQNYSFSIAGGNYLVETAGLSFNSQDRAIKIDDLELKPGPGLNSKLAFSLHMPQVMLIGIDIENFLFQNELVLEQFKVNGGEIELEINTDFKKIDATNSKKSAADSEAAIRKAIELLQIRELDFQDSKMTVNYRTGTRDVQSIRTGFDLVVTELLLDSTFNRESSFLSEIYEGINLSLQNFYFTLPDSTHQIEFSELSFDSQAKETVFSGVKLTPNSFLGKAGIPIFQATIDQIGIQNNNLKEIQESGILDLTHVRLENPQVKIYLDSKEKLPHPTEEKRVVENFINSILLQNVLIQKGKLEFYDKVKGSIPGLAFQNLEFETEALSLELLSPDLEIDLPSLLKKKLYFSFEDYERDSKDGMNRFAVKKLTYEKGNLTLKHFGMTPKIGIYEYARGIGHQTDVITAKAEEIFIENVDLKAFLENEAIKAGKVMLGGLDLDIFRDKRVPMMLDVIKKMPQELLVNGGQSIQLDSVLIQNGTIKYREFGLKSNLPGMLYFDSLSAYLAPFYVSKTNLDHPIFASKLVADARLMGQGELHLEGNLFYQKPYPMDISVNLGSFDLALINNFLERDVFVKIVSGTVADAKWDFRLDDHQAVGRMNFHYNDLKIALMDSVTLERGKGILKFYSFLANVLIRKNNPRGIFKKDVSSDIYVRRDQARFVFNAWWKASFSGLKGSVGMGNPKIPRRKEEE